MADEDESSRDGITARRGGRTESRTSASRVATAGATLAAVACALGFLYAATSAPILLEITVVVGLVALAMCALGIFICLITDRRGLGRAIVGGLGLTLPVLLIPAT